MTIAILGPEGTFSHECAEAVRGGEDLIFCRTIREVFERVMSGVADGIVPIENSSAGGVGETLDGLIRYDIWICAEYLLPIRYVFAAQNQEDTPKKVYAHPQAHEQCLDFLEECGCPVIHTASNAGSAHRAAEDPESCAVTTEMAAGRCGLVIQNRGLEDMAANTTRFIRISREQRPCAAPSKCSILIDPHENRAGLLCDLLSVVAEAQVNLTRIESRPSRRKMGEYLFFLDYETTGEWDVLPERLRALADVWEFGCYTCVEP